MTVLVVNASYEPLSLVDHKRAINLLLSEKAEIIYEDENKKISSPSIEMPHPVVIRLLYFVQLPKQRRDYVTNRVLFARDKWRCQYCGKHQQELKQGEKLTCDHVKPIARGGKNTWENVVTACSECNQKKGDRLPHEAHMYPKNDPKKPMYLAGTLLQYCKNGVQRQYVEEWCGGS
jgi:5-methylcytosine-specific restriction endonuclease McrA